MLSDVMQAVRLTGAIYFDVNARTPWVAETPPMSSICAEVMPAFEHVIAFHIMLDGWCWAQLADESEPAVRLEAGDAIIFPAGDGHFMSSEKGKRGTPDYTLYYRPRNRALPFVLKQVGGEGEPARFVCGYLGCDARPYNPVIEGLPRMMYVRRSGDESDLTLELLRLAVAETANPKPGGETILSKLSELMFLQALRKHMEELPAESRGWIAALRDRHVGEALRLMHSRPAENWTLDALAREVGMSRSVFADRFAQIMGTPAMQYLSAWRLQLAARLLERPNVSIAQAAAEVGYGSEAAFNRAFKKQVGAPPGAWRRERAPAVTA
ncbi:AraC family transcriptional regulator [Amphiplicatus metriothermophilus]|uniref:AraC family transcriptional regulator n=1 Tax=Amphiplicatus metriothermophilus TaxID=1519374 RepID=UPI001F3CD640|nr:AraC family transcriptional regulator [Amphiplicatus metriothermophilus]